jgi:hypothetical protein
MVIKNWALTQESFDSLLAWLHPDREQAGERYESIRCSLIRFFSARGFSNPEELADETIDRVARKIDELVPSYSGDPATYFFAVARLVCMGLLPPRKEAA